VGFVGRFEMTVPDILQILSLSKKTGKLRLSRLGNTGEVFFKHGKVTFAASDSARHTLSNTLISQRRLTESALMAALELQHLSSDNKRLGAILVEKGIITREALLETLRSQIEQVMSEFLSWENGFFRFDMTEIAADDGIAIDVSEFLTKSGIHPELLFHEGVSAADGSHEVEASRPEFLDAARGRPIAGEPSEEFHTERFDIGFDGETSASGSAERFDVAQTSAELSRMPRPEPLDAARDKRVEGPRPEPIKGPLADLTERQWEGERPPWIKPEASPSPALELEPTIRIVEAVTERPRPAPKVPLNPAPAVPRPEPLDADAARGKPLDAARDKRVEGPAPAPSAASKTPPAVPAAKAPKPMTSTSNEASVPTGAAPSGPSLEGPFPEIEPSRITDEIMLNSPIAPWVLVMHLAADVVSRGVLLFVRKDGITGHDQFGVGGARDSGDERIINIKIPWNQPSILAAAVHARTTYRGKISAGKWNDYFLNQLGGNRPDEAVIIPIIVAGKVVAIFYGDDAGSGTPLGDVERLQAVIDQTFSAVEASILAKRGKVSA
jgi:hypothetical protein